MPKEGCKHEVLMLKKESFLYFSRGKAWFNGQITTGDVHSIVITWNQSLDWPKYECLHLNSLNGRMCLELGAKEYILKDTKEYT